MSAFSFSRLVSLPMGQAYHYISKFSASELGPMMKNYSKMQLETGTSSALIHWTCAVAGVGYLTKRNNTLREIQAGH